jgi:hypothetical protein
MKPVNYCSIFSQITGLHVKSFTAMFLRGVGTYIIAATTTIKNVTCKIHNIKAQPETRRLYSKLGHNNIGLPGSDVSVHYKLSTGAYKLLL